MSKQVVHLKPSERPMKRDSEEAKEIRLLYNRALGSPEDAETNMAPNPVSFERKHISVVQDKSYVVLEKTDGNRYCLFLGTLKNGTKFSVFVDRVFDIYDVFMMAQASIYQGTLVDGELVEEEEYGVKGHIYLVFDVMCVEGEPCLNVPYHVRMMHAKRLFRMYEEGEEETHRFTQNVDKWDEFAMTCVQEQGKIMSSGSNLYALDVRCKPYFHSRFVATLLRKTNIATWKHKTDGIILMPMDDPIRLKTHYGMFKWKQEHTVDFLFQVELMAGSLLTPPQWVWKPFYQSKDRVHIDHPILVEGVVYSFTVIESKEKSSAQRKLIKAGFHQRTFVAECRIAVIESANQGNYIEISVARLRPDKKEANSEYTVSRTILNVKENISASELCVILKSN